MRKSLILVMLVALLLLAAAGRFHHLGVQSFWYDEGVAYGHSQRTLAELLPALQRNVHVPAYFGLLALYEDFVGHTEFALRSLSVLFSLLSIAFTYALGKRLAGVAAGMAAAAFVTLNTFSIYYAQEARMYAMMAAIGAASMWVFVGFWRPPPPATEKRLSGGAVNKQDEKNSLPANRGGVQGGDIFKYALVLGLLNALGMYTHVSYALVMLAQGVLAGLWLAADFWTFLVHRKNPPGEANQVTEKTDAIYRAPAIPALLYYVAANLLTIVLFLPWAGTALSQVGAQPNISDVIPFGTLLRLIQGWFAFGNTFEDNIGGMGPVVYFLLLFGLIILPPRQQNSHPQNNELKPIVQPVVDTLQPPRLWWKMLLPAVWVVVSVAVYGYLGLYARYLRFLLPAQTGFALWMGRGIAILWGLQPRQTNVLRYVPKAAAVFAPLALMVSMAGGLAPLYSDPQYQRDDYRGLVRLIESEAQPGDAIILSAPGLQEIFGYYYRGDIPVYPLPAGDDIAGDTARVIKTSRRIFAVLYGTAEQDPQGIVENTLNNQAYPVSDIWWGDIRLVRYVSPLPLTDLQDVDVKFGESITLRQYALSSDTVQPGDALQLRLEWQADAVLTTRYKVFVQMLNENGILVAQRDSEPGGGKSLTTGWQPGVRVTDHHALAIPADLLAGTYTLIVGLYDINDASARLAVNGTTALTIATIAVRR